MTALSLPTLRRIQILLNTLVGEHHVRRSLLREVCELMGSNGGLAAGEAHGAAVELLAALDDGIEVHDFDGRVERISTVVSAQPVDASSQSEPPPSAG
jgi:hypothetical protein